MNEEVKNPTDEQLKETFSALPHVDAEQIHLMFRNAPKNLNEVILKTQKTERWDILLRVVIADRNKAFRMAILAMVAFALWALALIFEPILDLIKYNFLELPIFVFLAVVVFGTLQRLSKKDGLARHVAFLDYLNTEKGKEWREYLRDELGYEVEPLNENDKPES